MGLDIARLSERSFLFCCEAMDSAELSVVSFEAREQVNQLSSTDVILLAWGSAAVTPDTQLLGHLAALAVHVPDGDPRTFHGVIASAQTTHVREDGRVERRIQLAPRWWLLTKRKHSRIFQDKTVREIVDILLDEIGAPRAWRVAARFAPRPYCVQYDETDYDFVARILAEEGVFYFFEEPADPESDILRSGETIVFADTAAAYQPLRGGPRLTFRQGAHRGDLVVPESTVGELALRSAMEPTAVRVSDYDFRRPLLDLTARSVVEPYGSVELEVHDHHGEHTDAEIPAAQARTYLEQLRAGAVLGQGVSLCRRLAPGARVELGAHELERVNGAYVVTSVEHRGTTPDAGAGGSLRYENRFAWVPADVPIRPPRPRRSRQQVMESATVVGPPGSELYTDALGRIKVQFPWDREGRRDEHSSCFLRVMFPWAGDGYGFQFIPRVGMEVLVGFTGGDVDRPVVMGCLYNATHPVPNGLPAQATRSSIRTRSSPGGGGANEISLDDEAGKEQVFVRAERDFEEEVGRDHNTTVRHDRRENVEGDRFTAVRGDRSDETNGGHRITVGSGRVVDVTGNDALQVSGTATRIIRGASETDVGGARRLSVHGAQSITVDEDAETVHRRSSLLVVQDRATAVVGSHANVTISGALSVNVGQSLAVSVGSAEEPKSAAASISGNLSLSTRGLTEIAVEKELTIRCGASVIRIQPDAVIIEAKKIVLHGESVEGASEKSTLRMGDKVEIQGPTLKLWSDDAAILELGKEAKLDGQAVKIKPGLAADVREQEKREEQAKTLEKETIQLFDKHGSPIPGAPYEISFFGWMEEGVSADGTVQVPKFPDVEVCHLRWGRPKAEREDPETSEEYEYEAEIFLQDGTDERESLRRKLHNLGYHGRDLAESVHAFQADTGALRTADADDIKADLAARHDEARPVPKQRG
ncbi:MAG: type VI secretion system tip protein TssI/VgrG [Polyangiaceae bacterium]